MYEYLEGRLAKKSPTHVVVDVSGVGYFVSITINTYEKVANLDKALLWVHQVVKEDEHALYGFAEESERSLFRSLISISGVGPAIARGMLSALPPKELRAAIIRGDVNLLKSVKGIGPKGAQRLVTELQATLAKQSPEEGLTSVSGTSGNREAEEAVSALVMLGFNKLQAERSVGALLRDESQVWSAESLIKGALKSS